MQNNATNSFDRFFFVFDIFKRYSIKQELHFNRNYCVAADNRKSSLGWKKNNVEEIINYLLTYI